MLARPHDWLPRGGVVFSYQARLEGGGDLLPATFTVQARPLRPNVTDAAIEAFYERLRADAMAPNAASPVLCEMVQLAGDGGSGIPSLRVASQAYAEVLSGDGDGEGDEISILSEDSGRGDFRLIDRTAYEDHLYAIADRMIESREGQRGHLTARRVVADFRLRVADCSI